MNGLNAHELLLDFGGKIGKKTLEELIIEHNEVLQQRNELYKLLKEIVVGYNSASGEMWIPDHIGTHIKIAEHLINKIENK